LLYISSAIMRFATYLAVHSAYAGSTLALLTSGVIFPLYIYPSDNCAAWSSVISGIQSHTTIQFYMVVNPGSGPGSAGSQPDTTYQACIARLRTTGAASGNNVKILGYVATGGGSRASADVLTDINTYSNWTSTYRPEGIFFDEASNKASFLSAYTTYTSQVRSKFTTSHIILNPGVVPETTGYFNIADQIVTFENYYSEFQPSDIVISSAAPASKQSVIIHDGPATTSSSLIHELTSVLKVRSIFVTNFPNAVAYQNVPSDYSNFLNLVAAQ